MPLFGRMVTVVMPLVGWAVAAGFAFTIAFFLGQTASATVDVCAAVARTPDGYLSLRTGPSASHPEIARIHSDTLIVIDDRERERGGKWWHVNSIMRPDGTIAHNVDGWVHSGFLINFPCP